MTRDDRRQEQRRPVYDGTGPMVRIVQAVVDVVVLLVYGLLAALFEGLRRVLFGAPDDAQDGHPVPDEDGTYRSGDQSERGMSGDRGASDANT